MIQRRTALAGLAGGLLAPAWAQQPPFPSRTVTIVVPYPPGGPADTTARAIATGLARELGQSVVVENKPGAGAAVGAEAVLAQPADGHTLMIGSNIITTGRWLYEKQSFDVARDFRAVAAVFQSPHMVVVSPSFPGTGIQDLIRMAKEKPGAVNYASAAAGTMPHLAAELFNQAAGVRMTHIPYRGSAPALTAVMAGEVPVYFDIQFSAQSLLKGGKLKTLGVTALKRSPQFPDVPTLAEQGLKDFEVYSWFGLIARSGTPEASIARLNAAVNTVMASREFQTQLEKLGAMPMGGTSKSYQDLIDRDTARWGNVIKAAGIRLT